MKIQHILGAMIAFVAVVALPGRAQAAGWSTSASWDGNSSMASETGNNAVKVRWGMTGGSCHMDYGTSLQHKTSFGCDEGEGVVRGLSTQTQGFRVKPDGRPAAPVVAGKPQAHVEKTPGIGGENQVKYSKAKADGQVWYSENWVTTNKINGMGSVHVNFVAHDAPVHIRYTEAGGSAYKYYTVVPGKDGHAVLGSLVEGKAYLVQVGFGEGYNWQKPMRMIAR